MSAQPTPATAGNFIAMLQGKTGGVALCQLDDALASLVQHVQQSGKKGSLTYKITLKPNARKGVKLTDDLKVDSPKEETGESYFFVGEGGTLLRNDPNQLSLGLKVVADDTQQPARAVNT